MSKTRFHREFPGILSFNQLRSGDVLEITTPSGDVVRMCFRPRVNNPGRALILAWGSAQSGTRVVPREEFDDADGQ